MVSKFKRKESRDALLFVLLAVMMFLFCVAMVLSDAQDIALAFVDGAPIAGTARAPRRA